MDIHYLILGLGILNFQLIVFQLSTGLRLIKTSFKTHKTAGIILAIAASTHGALALISSFI